MTFKVICKGPAFPLYSLDEPTPDDPGVDIPDSLLARIEAAVEEFLYVQDELRELFDGDGSGYG